MDFTYHWAAKVAKMSTYNGEDGVEETLEETLFDLIYKDDLEAATLLIEQSDIDINQSNRRQKTMLGLAVEHEHVPMVCMLIENGADINQPSFSSIDYYFETPVVTAARLQHEQLLNIFLDGKCELDKGGSSKDGKSALQWAATHGDLGMCKVLYDAGADVNWTGPFLHAALHFATISRWPKVVEWLLEKGAKVTLNGEGRSPLHIASVKGYINIVEHLVKSGCILDSTDAFGFTPFSLACLRGHLEIVQYLLEYALDNTQFNMEDALHRAAECGHLEVLDFLIRSGADVNSVNANHESALSIAARGQPISVQLLLENKADINIIDKRGYSPLQHAILREQIDVAMSLIKHGAKLHSSLSTIDSPLQSSYSISNPMLIKALIDAGCSLSCEKWFTANTIKTKLRELDFQYNSLRYRKSIDLQRDLWYWVMGEIGKPRSLLEASRISIRSRLVHCSKGQSIIAKVQELPLPITLKKYISLEEVFRI